MFLRVTLVLVIFLSWLGWAHRYYVCEICNLCHPAIPTIDSVRFYNVPYTLTVKADDYIILENYPEFCFDYASSQPIELKAHTDFYQKLGAFLQQNPEAKLRVTGRYLQKEQDQAEQQGRFNDLGVARAMAVVDKLHREFGIAAERLSAKGQKLFQDSLNTPISFEVLNYRPPLADNDSTKHELPDSNLINQLENSLDDVTYFDKSANFDYGSQTFAPGDDFLVYIDSLQSYFQRNPTHTLLVIGHTDSKGEAKFNEQLSLRRANAVRLFLEKRGIAATIKAEGKGESELLAPDQRSDGVYDPEIMSRNRRVNIKIIKSEK